MTLNIGWIGCGRHASQMLLPQLSRHDVRLAAICDINADARAQVARQFGVRDTYSDPMDLLAHPGLDAVGMAIGPDAHLELGLAALRRGLPVFMEKPPGANAAAARQLADAAARAGKPLVLGFMKRYSIGNRMAAQLIRRDFDPVVGFFGSYMTAPTYFGGAADYTAFLLHHCVHYMDLPAHLVGSPLRGIEPRIMTSAPGKLLMHVGMEFANGAIGTVVMGTLQSRGTPMEFIQVMGDHRRVEVENIIHLRYFRDPPFKADDPGASLEDGVDTLCWTPNFTAAANEDFKGYHALMGDTLAAFRGEANTAPDIASGVTAMEWLDTLGHAVARQG